MVDQQVDLLGSAKRGHAGWNTSYLCGHACAEGTPVNDDCGAVANKREDGVDGSSKALTLVLQILLGDGAEQSRQAWHAFETESSDPIGWQSD